MVDEGLHGYPETLLRAGTIAVLISGFAGGALVSEFILESDSYLMHGACGVAGAGLGYILWRLFMRDAYGALT